jgi:phospholipid/cholesterol/gamma-HCH transport system substrate-binding protein
MESAGGIRRGDPVQMRGVNIGRIQGFEMEGGLVNITLEIEGDWEIPADSEARLAGAGIFGGRTMEVIPGEASAPVAQGDTIRSAGVDAGILGTAEVMGTQANVLLGQLNQLFSDPTVQAVQGTAGELYQLTAELRRVVAAQQAQLTALTSSLQRSALAIETAAGAGPDVARVAARADTAMAQITLTTRTLDRTAGMLDSILARFEAGEGTLGRMARDESLYVNLNRAAEAVALLATDVRENPRRYIRIGIFGF